MSATRDRRRLISLAGAH